MQMKMRSTLALCLLLAPGLAQALEFKPSARLNGAGSYTSVPPIGSLGVNGDLFLVPALKQGDWTLLPLLAATGRSADNSVLEDAFFIESYNFMAKPQLRWQRGDASYRLLGGAKRSINKETVAEVWSEGLYDYEEYSAGLGGSWKALLGFLGDTSLTLERLHRTYVNFHENGTSLVGGKNYYSKDYDGTKLSLGLASTQEARLPWDLNYSLLLKDYTDSYLVKVDGTLDAGALRHDQLHHLDGDLLGMLGEKIAWGAQAGFDANVSDQGYFDPTELQFNEDFYGYLAESLGGNLTWLPRGQDGPTLGLVYVFTLRNYTGRLVRNPDGQFTQGKQADTEHLLSLSGRWPLYRWMAVTSGVDYDSVQSNQAFVTRIKNT